MVLNIARRPGFRSRCFAAGTLALILVAVVPAPAAHGKGMQGSLWLLGALPQGEFADNVDQNGFGLGGSFGYRIPQSPVSIGAELDYAIYGQVGHDVFFAGLPVRVRVQTDNSIVQGLLTLRLQPPSGVVRPYADGLIGFNYLFTTTTIKDRRDNNEIASDTNQDDTTLAYGGGGGVMFRVWHRDAGENKTQIRNVLVDLRGRYLVGGEAQYLNEGTIQVVGDHLVYDLLQSKTDLVTVGAGVTIEF